MRKFYTLFLLAVASLLNAQVPNSDFETGLGYGLENVANWGQFFAITISIDMETGETTQDEIMYTPDAIGTFCTSTNVDPHSGERAMLIRNAFNVTQNQVIPGEANLFNSEISELPTGWNFGIPVEADAEFNSLSFWYKFNPVGNDVAVAKLKLSDANGETIGEAKILISGATDEYTYASVPITFTSIADPAFLTIQFSMQEEGTTAVFGSSLTIDDLSVDNVLATHNFSASAFSLYPTIADQEINIQNGNAASDGNYSFSIINAEGRIISKTALEMQSGNASSINVSQLSSGIYFLKTESGNMNFTTKFIKK